MRRSRLSRNCWALRGAVLVTASVVLLTACGTTSLSVEGPSPGRLLTGKDAGTAEGLHSIVIGIQNYLVDHNDRVPTSKDVTKAGLGSEMSRVPGGWPTNPYTGGPMTPGTGPGQYIYVRKSAHDYRMRVYGANGEVLVEWP
jgi:hypothetical protein